MIIRLNCVQYNSVLCNCIKPISPIPSGIEFTFENYIKSQIEFPMMPYWQNRNLNDFIEAFDYLRAENPFEAFKISRPSLEKVLKYFYTDLATAIKKSAIKFKYADDFDFNVVSDSLPIFPVENIKVDSSDSTLWSAKVSLLLKYSLQTRESVIINMR